MARDKTPEAAEPAAAAAAPVEAPCEANDYVATPDGTPQEQKRIRDYFAWRPLPWWIVFFVGIFLLTKLQIVYNDSPCAVLGTQSPVGKSEVKKAFRTLSMCTHPDRLRGRLKRSPTKAEERRGEIIFNRANSAKDELSAMIGKGGKKSGGKVACYAGELELGMLHLISQATKAVTSLGITDYWTMAVDLFWSVVTFEAGFMNTCLSMLWMAFVLRIVKQFLGYLWRMGIFRFIISIVTTVIIGPIPTVVHFIILPFCRLSFFLKGVYKEIRPQPVDDHDDSANADAAQTVAPEPEAFAPTAAAQRLAAKAAEKEIPRGLRQRKKKETEEDKKVRTEQLLTGPQDQTQEETDPNQAAVPGARMPEGIWKCMAWSVREPIKARQNAADAVQFDLLLILTKPIIPLAMLICTGQVWNGLFSSLIVGHALRKWVPQMSYEAHHLLIMFFGTVHTLLGVSSSQVEDYAARDDGNKILRLAWTWSFKDVLCAMHMCLLGSTVTAMSSLGNEPSFAASFSAGIALRIALAQDSVQGMSGFQLLAAKVESSMREMGISLVASEEVVAYSGDGIGDCAGGPFRMLFGDGNQAVWAARILKIWLMVMPLMATGQWLLRTIHAGKMLGKRNKTRRFVQRLILFILGLLQCILLANLELNASNGALGNFWVAMLFAALGESLMCTYDVRGQVRQLLFLLLFLGI